MVELEQRVVEAQEKLSEALAELAKFSELRKGLESADLSLTSAAKAIIDLSEAAEKHTQNLSDAASALAAAVEVMRRTDFGEIRRDLSTIHEIVREGHEMIGTQIKRSSESLASEIRQISDTTAAEIKKSVVPMFSELSEEVKKNSFITWVLIAISTAASVYAIFVR